MDALAEHLFVLPCSQGVNICSCGYGDPVGRGLLYAPMCAAGNTGMRDVAVTLAGTSGRPSPTDYTYPVGRGLLYAPKGVQVTFKAWYLSQRCAGIISPLLRVSHRARTPVRADVRSGQYGMRDVAITLAGTSGRPSPTDTMMVARNF